VARFTNVMGPGRVRSSGRGLWERAPLATGSPMRAAGFEVAVASGARSHRSTARRAGPAECRGRRQKVLGSGRPGDPAGASNARDRGRGLWERATLATGSPMRAVGIEVAVASGARSHRSTARRAGPA